MAVNLTSTGACLVCVILRIILPKFIELWPSSTTFQSYQMPRLSEFDNFPDKCLKGYKNWAQSCNCLRCVPAPDRLRRAQSVLSSSHRTCADDTICRNGFLHIQHSGISPLLLEPTFNTLFTEIVHLIFRVFTQSSGCSLPIPKARLTQFRSLLLQHFFA